MSGPGTALSITAFGMATPLAPTALDSCAAARAGISRFSELNIVDLCEDEALGHEPLTGCPAGYVSPGFTGAAKVLQLGRLALADLQSRSKLSQDDLRRTGIIVNLSDRFYEDCVFTPDDDEDSRAPSEVWAAECENLLPNLLLGSGFEGADGYHGVVFGGHSGFVEALEDAGHLLSTGRLDRCLVGGIESCLEARLLRSAALKRVLKTDANPVGFVPGEAAAFLLLERAPAASTAAVLGHRLVEEGPPRFSSDPPDGGALARAIGDAIRHSVAAGHTTPTVAIGDLNGDEYRARDWGSALTRLRARRYLDDVALWLPALAFGDTGAAAEAVGVCFGMVAQQQGWIPPGLLLEWSASDRGARAAIGFTAVPS